jgi:hypothetical protein
VADFCDDWRASRAGEPPAGRIGAALKPLIARHGRRQVRAAWQGYLADRQGRDFANPQDFAQSYGVHRDKHAQQSSEDGSGWVPMPDEPEVAA